MFKYIYSSLCSAVAVWVVVGILAEISMQLTWDLITIWDLPIPLDPVLMKLLKPPVTMVLAHAALGMN